MAAPAALAQTTPQRSPASIAFRNILLAIDFSPQTEAVLAAGLQLAALFQARLFLVHAATPGVYGTGAEPVPLETFDVNLNIANAEMQELVQNHPALAEFPHEEIVSYAMPADLIEHVIRERSIELVIAGSHGAAGMERLAVGSVAEYLLHAVRCPVLILGPHAQLPKNPFASILLCTSLRPQAFPCADSAVALAEQFHSSLTLLHVVQPKQLKTVQPELLEPHLLAQMQALVPSGFSAQARLTPRLEYGRPGALILALGIALRSSLIVVGARPHRSLADHYPWSTLAEVLRLAPCPVLCVQDHIPSSAAAA